MNGKQDPGSTRALRLYFRDVVRFPLLTAAEEKELARRVQSGDRVALQIMVLSNLRFVLKVARTYRNSGVPLQDLINEGNLGLMEAAKRFDPERNNRFTSYAIWWIRQAIVKLLYQASLLRQSQRTANILYRIAQHRPTGVEQEWDPGSLSQELGLTANEVKRARLARFRVLPLDSPLDTGNDLLLSDVLEYHGNDSPHLLLEQQQMKEQIERSLASLTPREEQVLRMRYGLNDREPHTLHEIGSLLNLSRERIRQIEDRALSKLRDSSAAESLASYLRT